MNPQDEPGLARLSEEILRYLRTHPQAADTVDGIVGWWLPRQRHDEAVDRVQDALDKLVASGLLEKITLVDGTVLYADPAQKNHFPQ
jgi:Fe2+ or Zn2+ uptake regulation protein